MKTTVIIDANGQLPISIKPTSSLLSVLDLDEVLICGSSTQARTFFKAAQSANPKVPIKTHQANKLQGESIIFSTAYVMDAASKAMLSGTRLLIISRNTGFKKFSEHLTKTLKLDVTWIPTANADTIESFLNDGAESMTDNIRTATNQIILNKNSGKPMLLPALANELMVLIPALKNPEERERLFGKREFKSVLISCGLRTEGNTVYPVEIV